jgi:hypothetical protein
MSETEYNTPSSERPRKCPKCGAFSYHHPDACLEDWDNPTYITELKIWSCFKCRFTWTETWKFEKWEPEKED